MKFYLLTDTLEESIFCYVGRTIHTLEERKAQHWDNYSGNKLKKTWVDYVKLMGGQLIIKELEDFDAEKNWIYAYQINSNYIPLNSSTDFISSEKYSENILTNTDFKNPLYKRFHFTNDYLYPHYKQNRKFFLTHHKNYNMEKTLPFIHFMFFPEDTLMYPSDILKEYTPEINIQLILSLRDMCLYFSTFDKKFYFDLYSRFISIYQPTKETLIEEFNIYKQIGIPFYKKAFLAYLKKIKKENLLPVIDQIF